MIIAALILATLLILLAISLSRRESAPVTVDVTPSGNGGSHNDIHGRNQPHSKS